MAPEMLQLGGHHYPDFHYDAVEAMSRSPSLTTQGLVRGGGWQFENLPPHLGAELIDVAASAIVQSRKDLGEPIEIILLRFSRKNHSSPLILVAVAAMGGLHAEAVGIPSTRTNGPALRQAS